MTDPPWLTKESVAHALARHRVRVQREAGAECRRIAREYDADGDAAQAAGDWDRGAVLGHRGAAANECADAVEDLTPDAPESLEALLARVRESHPHAHLYLDWDVQTGRWAASVGYTLAGIGDTAREAVRALLAEETRDDGSE